ncbi:putative uncharacterized protein BRD3OS isoform X2 [Ovis aries]|uniref:putative uncharacterized protein BRD3OS isoform X2 n=1 Tax=Ovis aries TaxID=9940 RepID=UPI0029528589|nr:putative uncharacterized protein BRD3OS isoform X2 [Ovis aries]
METRPRRPPAPPSASPRPRRAGVRGRTARGAGQVTGRAAGGRGPGHGRLRGASGRVGAQDAGEAAGPRRGRAAGARRVSRTRLGGGRAGRADGEVVGPGPGPLWVALCGSPRRHSSFGFRALPAARRRKGALGQRMCIFRCSGLSRVRLAVDT